MKATYELEMRLVKQKAGLQVAKKELAFVELERRYAKLEARFDDVASENGRHIVRISRFMWARHTNGLYIHQDEARSNARSLQAERAASAKTLKELETLLKAHSQLQRRFATEETASQTTNSKIEELQRALKDAKDALKRETERVAKVEKTVVDLRGKNEDLQKELDDLVKEDTGRNGEVSP